MIKQQKGFTLAEVLITLSILGVVAAITVPSLINKQTEAANRTKLKKAMTNYEKVLSQLVIDYDIKTDAGMTKELVTDNDNCSRTTEYFKKTNKIDDCIFRTADGVWWDITNIKNPIISLDKTAMTADNSAIKTKAESIESDKTSFVMVGYIEDNGGILRINDKGVASGTNASYLSKLYSFASPDRAGGNNSTGTNLNGKPIGDIEAYYISQGVSECSIENFSDCYENSSSSFMVWVNGQVTNSYSCNDDRSYCSDEIIIDNDTYSSVSQNVQNVQEAQCVAADCVRTPLCKDKSTNNVITCPF